MTTKHPYYRHKWQWAEAQATELQQRISARRSEHLPSYDRSAIRRKMESLDRLENERQRFVQVAQRFKASNT